MKNTVNVDVAIVGGGIAGLWVLNRLKALGYSVILLESEALGAGQTSKAQGIIHGGTKYALQGMMTSAAQSISTMPERWKQCLAGQGEVDLSKVQILSKQQYLWSPGTFSGKIGGFLASMTLNSQVKLLKREEFPLIFQNEDFKGQVYELDEMVIDMPSLIRELVRPNQELIFKMDPFRIEQLHFNDAQQLDEMVVSAEPLEPITIKAQKYIFTAGAGNEILLNALKNKEVAMQRRPLHMVMMKIPTSHPLYAHCLGMSATPRITITTHVAEDRQAIWYLGGQLAEEGVTRDQASQIQIAKEELHVLFPWIDFSEAQFASFFVDRVEGLQEEGKRPDSCVLKNLENIMVAWPTKFALAPKLGEEIVAALGPLEKHVGDVRALRAWPMPAVVKPIWDELL